MREILFRGKCGYNDEWVEGFYYQAKLNRSDKELCHYITIPHPESDGQPSDHIMVHPETVGQFTGLTDKNGKKIFDGDILKAIAGNPVGEPIVAKVVVNLNDYELMWDIEHSYEIEIIGNIHDNPELLENP